MNCTMIKIAVCSAVSFLAGTVAGYFIRKKYDDAPFEEISAEEMQRIEEGLKEDVKEIKDNEVFHTTSSIDVLVKSTPNTSKEDYAKAWKAVKNYSSEENANELIDIKDIDVELDDLDDFEEGERESEKMNSKDFDAPFEISMEEFYGNDGKKYEKTTVYWYEKDNVLCDENEERIEDAERYVGCDLKGVFEFPKSDSNDPDVIFIRNERYQTDYEVIRYHSSYWDRMKE